jgi:hypothetical protein
MPWISETAAAICRERVEAILDQTVAEARSRLGAAPRRVLLLPPDITRMHSGSGWITESLYERFAGEADVHVIPTLGQHEPHTPEQNRTMFGSIPNERIHAPTQELPCRSGMRSTQFPDDLHPRHSPGLDISRHG